MKREPYRLATDIPVNKLNKRVGAALRAAFKAANLMELYAEDSVSWLQVMKQQLDSLHARLQREEEIALSLVRALGYNLQPSLSPHGPAFPHDPDARDKQVPLKGRRPYQSRAGDVNIERLPEKVAEKLTAAFQATGRIDCYEGDAISLLRVIEKEFKRLYAKLEAVDVAKAAFGKGDD